MSYIITTEKDSSWESETLAQGRDDLVDSVITTYDELEFFIVPHVKEIYWYEENLIMPKFIVNMFNSELEETAAIDCKQFEENQKHYRRYGYA